MFLSLYEGPYTKPGARWEIFDVLKGSYPSCTLFCLSTYFQENYCIFPLTVSL